MLKVRKGDKRMEKKRKQLDFTKDLMFCEVMKDLEVCKELIERIINKSLERIVYSNQQETITAGTDVRSIRLDVLVETKDKELIDVEMQVGNYSSLPLRFRGYQSIIDSSYWNRGDLFKDLKETYIIFLCLNDPFSSNLPLYTFEPCCRQDILTDYDFKLHWIALNSSAWKSAPPSIKNLLKYMYTNKCQDGDELIQKIDEIVLSTNKNAEKAVNMTTVQDKIDEFNNYFEDQARQLKSQAKEIKSKDKEIEDLKKQIEDLKKK